MKTWNRFLAFMLALMLFTVINACKKDSPAVIVPETKIYSLTSAGSWKIASTPLRFQESLLTNDISYGYNRAKFSWYTIDPLFYEKTSSLRPANITNEDISSDDCRNIFEAELFPSKYPPTAPPVFFATFNLDFYPSERGPWNFDTDPSVFSSGIDYDGKLNNPSSRWGGIMHILDAVKFEINYLDFWMPDPFTTSPDANGELYINLGDISEDVLRDGLISAENTTDGDVTETAWGKVWPLSTTYAFASLGTDKGLDELNNAEEDDYFRNYLEKVQSICSSEAYQAFSNDPSGDNYHYFRGGDYDDMNYKVRQRYKNYDGDDQNSTQQSESYPTISASYPDGEDLNRNNILETGNNYFEYKISINKDVFFLGTNYITDVFQGAEATMPDGSRRSSLFYHFRIPLKDFTGQFGTPSLSGNQKTLRLYLTGFATPVNLRLINFEASEEIIDSQH